MSDLKSYVQNESLVSLEDLIELGNAYKAIAESSKLLKMPPSEDIIYNMDVITREINRRVKEKN